MLHEALRLIRVYHDMKQGELPEKLGISKSYMSEIEKGTKSPTVELFNKYAEVFKMPPASILFFAETWKIRSRTGAPVKRASSSPE